jgi:hypothetical protein
MRATIVVLVTTITFAAASFFGGVWRFGHGASGRDLESLALSLLVGGVTAGVLVGLVVAHGTAPTTPRPRRFWSLGATLGVVIGVLGALSLQPCIPDAKLSELTGSPTCIAARLIGTSLWHVTATVAVLAIVGGGIGAAAGLALAGIDRRA